MFITGDGDTRVEPLHARKMAALVQAATGSDRPVLLRYDTKAGHVPAGASLEQQIADNLDYLTFLFWQLDVPTPQDASDATVPQAGKNGVGYASCGHCPPPPGEGLRTGESRVTGVVLLRALVTVDGRVRKVRVIASTGRHFEERAVDAVKNWLLKPARGPDGRPVEVWQDIEMNFQIRSDVLP
jgi:TonB family protein